MSGSCDPDQRAIRGNRVELRVVTHQRRRSHRQRIGDKDVAVAPGAPESDEEIAFPDATRIDFGAREQRTGNPGDRAGNDPGGFTDAQLHGTLPASSRMTTWSENGIRRLPMVCVAS